MRILKGVLFLIICAVCILRADISYAMSIHCPDLNEGLRVYNLGFMGKVTGIKELPASENKSRYRQITSMTINVERVFKGNIEGEVTVHPANTYLDLAVGDDVTIFTQNPENKLEFKLGICSAIAGGKINENISIGGGASGAALLEIFTDLHTKLDVIDQQIAKTHDMELYRQKAALLEKFYDYDRLKAVLEEALALGKLRDTKKCDGIYAWKEGMPTFLKGLDAAQDSLLFAYGRTLYNLGEYQAALRPLCLVNATSRDGDKPRWLSVALLKAGNGSLLTADNANFSDAGLENQEFQGVDFHKVGFQNAELTNVKFSDSNLAGADFAGSKIRGCDIKKADFSGASFRSADVYATFEDVDFRGANLSGASINVREISKAKFNGADFSNAKFLVDRSNARTKGHPFYLSEVDFSGANFSHATISGIRGAKVIGAVFKNATIEGEAGGVDFSGVNLQSVVFKGTALNGAIFRGADLRGAKFLSDGYNFADLTGADLSTASLEGAELTGAHYDDATRFPGGFQPNATMVYTGMVVRPVDFSIYGMLQPPDRHYRLVKDGFVTRGRADLSGSRFDGRAELRFEDAKLENASFRHVRGRVEFSNSDAKGADFSYADLHDMIAESRDSPANAFEGAKLHCARVGVFINIGLLKDADLSGAIFDDRNHKDWPFDMDPIKEKLIFWYMPSVISKYGPADYSNMDFSGCAFDWINFGSTNLSGAKFKGAYLYETDLSAANLTNANFDAAQLTTSTKFPQDFDISKFKMIPTASPSSWGMSFGGLKSQLQGIYPPPTRVVPNFPGEDLSNLSICCAWMPGTNMKGSKIRFTDWSATNFQGADLSEADATGAVFYDAILENADLTKSNLMGADLRKTSLLGAKLEGANLKNALYDDATLWPKGFDPAKAGAFLVSGKGN